MIIYPHESNESATEYAYKVLHKNIVRMELSPGTAIAPLEVAAELKISRTPLQSACARLASEGLLSVVPQKGSYVSLIDLQRVNESVFMRNILDQAAVRHLCGSPRREEAIRSLEANMNQQEFALKIGTGEEIIELDNKYHRIIYEMGGMNNIQMAVSSISVDQDRVRYMKMNSQLRMNETVKEHNDLLNAIKRQDGDLASLLSYEHISKFGVDIDFIYSQHPDYFSNYDDTLLSHFVCKKELFYNMIKK
ncbi:MAG: GntR family transcriptional regulator [Lachnospiraceae bacterium]